jgi:DNA-binding transcriptional MocR family regulator
VGGAAEVHVSLVGRKDLAGEIYRQLRRAILDGRLPPGGRLPPTRELAGRLSVSRTTVAVAYDRLGGEGFVTSRVGAGTFVSAAVAGSRDRPRPAGGALRPQPLWDSIAVPAVSDHPAKLDFSPGRSPATSACPAGCRPTPGTSWSPTGRRASQASCSATGRSPRPGSRRGCDGCGGASTPERSGSRTRLSP